MLKLEGKMMNGLHNLGINGEYMSKFLKLNSHVWDNTYVLDIRHSSVMVSACVISCFKTFSRFKTTWNQILAGFKINLSISKEVVAEISEKKK